jgi:hypothetical protein
VVVSDIVSEIHNNESYFWLTKEIRNNGVIVSCHDKNLSGFGFLPVRGNLQDDIARVNRDATEGC